MLLKLLEIAAEFVDRLISFVLTLSSRVDILLILRETKASIVEKLTMFASKLVMKADMFPELVLM